VIAEELRDALRRAGHVSEILVTPQNRFGRQLSAYWATWLTDVGETADGRAVSQVISLRFPSYAVRHDRHVCWLNHRMREYYDMWDHLVRGLGRKGKLKLWPRRKLFHVLDRWLLTRNVTRVVAQSQTIQKRLTRWGSIPSTVLYPPAPVRPYRHDGYGDHVFAVSRLVPLKRIHLLVEAVALMKDRTLRFRIAGEGADEAMIKERIRQLQLGDRIVMLGAVSEEQLVDEYARCRAVYFAPWNEDYGFVTLEAFSSAKAVLTAADSGGPAELVEDGVTGLVAPEATPPAIAERLDRLADAALAARMGAAARAVSARHTWEQAVTELVQA
jgi:glycosyltransferase involved in cell wall biosynthesis